MKEASYYEKLDNQTVKCNLCPHNCLVKKEALGICGVRQNINGTFYALTYGRPCSINIDPIEKKPLYHFLPGEEVFSIATIGCNFQCSFCQNWQISKKKADNINFEFDEVSPEKVIEMCRKNNCKIISYTYTEPTIFYEYMLDIAKLAKEAGIKNVIVSNGFINEKPLRELCKYIDAANIDLKAFNEEFYKKNCGGRLEPVLKTLKILKQEKIWVEITNLLIPKENDNLKEIEEMSKWIAKKLDQNIPLHFSRFHPDYKMTNRSITSSELLESAEKIAQKYLNYVYVGNVSRENNTICPKCRKPLIKRSIMSVMNPRDNNLTKGKCSDCNEKIKGVWN